MQQGKQTPMCDARDHQPLLLPPLFTDQQEDMEATQKLMQVTRDAVIVDSGMHHDMHTTAASCVLLEQ